MSRVITLLIFSFFLGGAYGKESIGRFSARVSSIDYISGLAKFRVDFSNARFVTKGNKLRFWDNRGEKNLCRAKVLGRSPDYILMKIDQINRCRNMQNLSLGNLINFYSDDLVANINSANELQVILNKKRVALHAKMMSFKRLIDTHPERVDSINERYKTLRDKLELEWRDALIKTEEERALNLQSYKNYASRLDDVDFKIEKYTLKDTNRKVDRWSLDPYLYDKK